MGFFVRADALFKIAAQAGAVIFIVFHDGTGDAVYQVGGFAGATGEEPCPHADGVGDRICKMIGDELGITIDKALDTNPDLKKAYDTEEDVKRIIDAFAIIEPAAEPRPGPKIIPWSLPQLMKSWTIKK